MRGDGPDQAVARVFARQEGGKIEMLGQGDRHVLQRVDGDVDLAQLLRAIELLGEQALAAGILQRLVEDLVARRREGVERGRELRRPTPRRSAVGEHVRLRQRQGRAARADP